MNLIIEAEVEEERDVILREVSLFKEMLARLGVETTIEQVIIPVDIEDAARRIQGDTSSKIRREHQEVAARVVNSANGVTMLFNPLLFFRGATQIRWLTYLHEMLHVFTKTVFPPIETDSPSVRWYLMNLYILYDEYYANRKSLEMAETLFTQKSDVYKRHLRGYLGHYRALRDEGIYYLPLKQEICLYRQHSDIRLFLSRIQPIWDQGAKAIVYSYAFADYMARSKRLEGVLSCSKFVNSRTVALIDFFRLEYGGAAFDLFPGLQKMKEFALNFGMRWEDMENGCYDCHIYDI